MQADPWAHVRCSLNFLKGVISGSSMAVSKGDSRSSDYSSYEP